MASESQRVVNVIRQAIDQSIGEQVRRTPGVIHSVDGGTSAAGIRGVSLLLATITSEETANDSGMTASAYIEVDEYIDGILLPAGAYVSAGDYAVIAIAESGRAWIDRILPTSLYSKLVVDPNKASIGVGSGTWPVYDFGQTGQTLMNDNGRLRWGNPERSGSIQVSDGGSIPHGLTATPTSVTVTPSVAGEIVSVTSLGATTFTVAIRKYDGTTGTTQTVYWRAGIYS